VDDIKLMLDQLSELSNEQIEALNEQILSEFDSVEAQEYTPEIVEQMTALADALDAVKSEARSREAQAEELANRAAEATTRVREVAGDAEVIESEDADEEKPEEEDETEEVKDPTEASTATDAAAEFTSTETEAATAVPAEDAEAAVEAEDEVTETPDAPVEETQTTDEDADTGTEFASEEATAATETTDADSEFTADAEDQPEAEEPTTPTEEPTQAQEEESPVTAATDGAIQAPADRRPDVTPETKAIPVTITAGADIPGVAAGSELKDAHDIAVRMGERLHSLRNVHGGDGEQHIVARVNTEYPSDRFLTGNVKETAAKIENVAGPAAIVAAGGFATPLEQRYDVWGLPYTNARPVRDSLPSFQADRGGIRFIVPPVLSDYEDAVGVWTEANDIAAAGVDGPTKAVMTVTGAEERTAVLDAITLQLQVGNLFARAYPELLARHNELALVQHSRLAERTLVAKIDAASTQVTAAKVLGFARDFLVQIRKAAAAYRSRHRIDNRTNLRAIVPSWVVDAVAADLTMQMPGDDTLSTSVQEVNRLLGDAGVTVTESPDLSLFPAQGAGALTNWPASFEWYLFSEGTFLFLDGGTLDLGIIRDSTLISTNDYRMFVETFEGLAFVGVESLAITSSLVVSGEAAALVDSTPA
jgi:chemotaxis protein histidine kinase CheA